MNHLLSNCWYVVTKFNEEYKFTVNLFRKQTKNWNLRLRSLFFFRYCSMVRFTFLGKLHSSTYSFCWINFSTENSTKTLNSNFREPVALIQIRYPSVIVIWSRSSAILTWKSFQNQTELHFFNEIQGTYSIWCAIPKSIIIISWQQFFIF